MEILNTELFSLKTTKARFEIFLILTDHNENEIN